MPLANDMNFVLLLPEILVSLLAILIILIDVFARSDSTRTNLSYLAAVGLVIPMIATVAVLGGLNEVSFSGTYVVDPMAVFFKLLFLIAAAISFLLSTDYVRARGIAPGEFYATVLFATLGFMLMASGRELITIYISLEMASIPLYMLVAMAKNDIRSNEAGIKYLLLGAMSSAVTLYGMVLLYAASGSTILPEIAARIGSSGVVGVVAVVFVIVGLGFKIAAVPFHMWVPDVYQGAPTPVTAFLSVGSKAAGFALILRVLTQGLLPLEMYWSPLLAILAAITMTFGNIAALRQTNIKRLLGYSSIAQAGYAMMALAIPGTAVASGLMFFLLAYTLTNLGAFAGLIAISRQIGSEEIEDFQGMGQRGGILALFTTLCFLSLVGMPPMAGFVSKFYLFFTVFEQGLVWLVVVGVLNTAIAAFYYVKVVRSMYFMSPPTNDPIRAPLSLHLALWGSTIATIALGIFANPFIRITDAAANQLMSPIVTASAAVPATPVRGGAANVKPGEINNQVLAGISRALVAQPGQFTIDRFEPMQWSDSSLGCQEPGKVYGQAITPGYRIAVTINGQKKQVHSDIAGRAIVCDRPTQ